MPADGDAAIEAGQGNSKISAYASAWPIAPGVTKPEKFATFVEPLPTLRRRSFGASRPSAPCMRLTCLCRESPRWLHHGGKRACAGSAAAPEHSRGDAGRQAWLSGFIPIQPPSWSGCAHTNFGRNCLERINGCWDYVSNGGTLVVQYQREFAWDKFQYAPYPR